MMPPPTMTTSARAGSGPVRARAAEPPGRRARARRDRGEGQPGRARRGPRAGTGCSGGRVVKGATSPGVAPSRRSSRATAEQAALPLAGAGAEAGVALHRLEVAVARREGAPHLLERHVLAGAERWSYPRAASPARRPATAASAAEHAPVTSPAAQRPGDRRSSRPDPSGSRRRSSPGSKATGAPASRASSAGGRRRAGDRDRVAAEARAVREGEAAKRESGRGRGPPRAGAPPPTSRPRGAAPRAPRPPGRRPGSRPARRGRRRPRRGRAARPRPERTPGRSPSSKVGGWAVPPVQSRTRPARTRRRRGAGASAWIAASGLPPSRQRPRAEDETRHLAAGPPHGLRHLGGPVERRVAGQAVATAEPAAEPWRLLQEQHAPAGRGERLGGAQPGGARSDHERVEPLLCGRRVGGGRPVGEAAEAGERAGKANRDPVREARPGGEVVVVEAVGRREVHGAEEVVGRAGEGVLRLDPEPVAARRAAGPDVGLAVDPHEAAAAAAGEAEGAARAVVLGAAREERPAGGEERRGHALAGACRDPPPVHLDGAVRREARVGEAGHRGSGRSRRG